MNNPYILRVLFRTTTAVPVPTHLLPYLQFQSGKLMNFIMTEASITVYRFLQLSVEVEVEVEVAVEVAVALVSVVTVAVKSVVVPKIIAEQ